jgi:hypothetical protein
MKQVCHPLGFCGVLLFCVELREMSCERRVIHSYLADSKHLFVTPLASESTPGTVARERTSAKSIVL